MKNKICRNWYGNCTEDFCDCHQEYEWMSYHDRPSTLNVVLVVILLALATFLAMMTLIPGERWAIDRSYCQLDDVVCQHEEEPQEAEVTAYNTFSYQTDNTPCIAANGENICGRTDAVACPTHRQLGEWVQIDGKYYECVDRTASKYNGRYDISFDKDVEGAKEFGVKTLKVK